MTICRDWSLVKKSGPYAEASVLYCRSWSCEICAPRRRKQLMRQAFTGKPITFITLTVNTRNFDTPADAARALVVAFRRLVRRAKQRYRLDAFPFLAVFEATKRGWPHLHVLTRVRWLDQAWLSDQMGDLLGSPVVDIRRVTNKKKAAAYVAKYVGKNPHRFATCKRYWSSQDYRPQEDKDAAADFAAGWLFDVARSSLEEVARILRLEGYVGGFHDDRWIGRHPP